MPEKPIFDSLEYSLFSFNQIFIELSDMQGMHKIPGVHCIMYCGVTFP